MRVNLEPDAGALHYVDTNKRWLALFAVCLGVLMTVIDATIINVALPSIGTNLHFSATSLVWVVNAYVLTYGSCLLPGGRLSDLYGRRRIFLIGIAAFTVCSLACGLSTSQMPLVCARGLQGIAAAVVLAVGLSLVVRMFPDPAERARAIGFYGFILSCGGSLGVFLGGLLTSTVGWHWIFLVNVPIGILVYTLCSYAIPAKKERLTPERLDVWGSVTLSSALMLFVYSIVSSNDAGGSLEQSILLMLGALILFTLFIVIELRATAPIVPFSLFHSRVISLSNVIAGLWSAARSAWFFIAALYLQNVLGYDALHVGMGFLPATVSMAVLSIGLSARLVTRLGLRAPIIAGLLLASLGLVLFANTSPQATLSSTFPAMTLLGAGAGIVLNPLLMAATRDVSPDRSGLASGLVSTANLLGGAVGLTILVSAAAAHTSALLNQGVPERIALNSGYHLAFTIGAILSVLAAALTFSLVAAPRCYD